MPVSTWAFIAACAIAGALAVPVNALTSPLSALVMGLLGLLGLRVYRWSGLTISMKRAPEGFARAAQLAASLGLGLVVGLLLLAVIRLVIQPAVPAASARIAAAAALPIWRRLIIIYVAAVGEELVFRLLLLSAIAGMAVRLQGRSSSAPSRRVVRFANAVSAFAFAAVHLPAWTAVGPVSLGLALMVLTLNFAGGVVFGHLFVTRGIVAAMWGHAGADCAIQLVGPLT